MQVRRDMIDPELRRRGALLGRVLAARSEEQLRRGMSVPGAVDTWLRARVPRGLTRTEEHVTRPDGSTLRLFVYRSTGPRTGDAPGLLWIHGGGYASGAPEYEAAGLRPLISGSGAVVVSPAYRLSTEAPYPAALDDCYAALRWLRDHAERLGVRSDRIAVAGASAGGGLTAATTLYARDRGKVAVAFQMPIYPMIDDRGDTASTRDNDAPVWDAVTNRSAWRMYLGDLAGTADVPAYAAPARATDFSGLPPTLTYVGDIEAFRDETVAYVENLRAAGVPVEFREFPGAYHGFDAIVPKAAVSVAARAFRDQWFGYAVRTYSAPQP
ncbi:alpha/beta hydrolase [Actinomycetospora aeridis]|uniref:Alpha/beta hydrolase n=1 Tax=Actinomycetospora aeridis TaxID=3129231 RepID=A0ABU8NB31_9PSEU